MCVHTYTMNNCASKAQRTACTSFLAYYYSFLSEICLDKKKKKRVKKGILLQPSFYLGFLGSLIGESLGVAHVSFPDLNRIVEKCIFKDGEI